MLITTMLLSWGQLKSKRWLSNTLEDIDVPIRNCIFVNLAGMLEFCTVVLSSPIDKIRSYDIDESCLEIANTINLEFIGEDWQNYIIQNIMDIDYVSIHLANLRKANNRMSRDITDCMILLLINL